MKQRELIAFLVGGLVIGAGFWISGWRPVMPQPSANETTLATAAPPEGQVDGSSEKVMRRLEGVPLLLQAEDEQELDHLTMLLDTARTDPKAALAWLANPEHDGDLEEAFKAIALGWAETDPEGCSRWVSAIPDENLQAQAALGLAAVWSSKDGEATLTWQQTLPEGEARDLSLVETAVGWSKTAPAPALERFLTLEPETARDQAIDELLWRAVELQPTATLDRLSRLEQPRRDELLQDTLISNAMERPADSWREAARIVDPEAAQRVRIVALGSIAAEDPARAQALFKEAGSPVALAVPVAVNWFENDPDAVLQWMETLPTEEHKQAVREALLDFEE